MKKINSIEKKNLKKTFSNFKISQKRNNKFS